MNFNIKNPFTGLHGETNGATYMLMQREENLQRAIRYFTSLATDDFDINDIKMQREVLRRYNLEDITHDELLRIEKAIRAL